MMAIAFRWLFAFEFGVAFFEEGGHAFAAVFGGEQARGQVPFEFQGWF